MYRNPLVPAHLAATAPELDVEQWFGPAKPLSDLRGQVVVVHAFQMLCPGCVQHGLPQAARIAALFPEVQVIGLHTVFEHHEAMTPVSLKAFLHEYRVSFPVAVDARDAGQAIPRTMRTYGLRGTPSLLLVDAEGRLRANVFGQVEDLALGHAIGTLMAEAQNRTQTDLAPPQSAKIADGSDCSDESCAVD